MEQPESLGDRITRLGTKFGLTTTRFMGAISGKKKGEVVTKTDIMRELIGPGYDAISEGDRNVIFTTLIEPDIDNAIESGLLEKKGDNTYERI